MQLLGFLGISIVPKSVAMFVETELVGYQTLERGSQYTASVRCFRNTTSKKIDVVRMSEDTFKEWIIKGRIRYLRFKEHTPYGKHISDFHQSNMMYFITFNMFKRLTLPESNTCIVSICISTYKYMLAEVLSRIAGCGWLTPHV